MQHLARPREPGHNGANRQFERFRNLLVRELLKVEHHEGKSVSVIELRQRLVESKNIRTEQVLLFSLILHPVERNLRSAVTFATHLGIAVPEYADKPPLDRLNFAQGGTRPVSLEERLLRQLFSIGPRTGPPVGNTKEKPLVLPYPVIESVIADLHCFSSETVIHNRVAARSGFIPQALGLFLYPFSRWRNRFLGPDVPGAFVPVLYAPVPALFQG